MSSERGGGNTSSSRPDEGTTTGESLEETSQQTQPSTTHEGVVPLHVTPSSARAEPERQHESESASEEDRKPAARPSLGQAPAPSQVPPAAAQEATERPRQVIAVSANRGPTAFFNLAKRFLITDELCDLSALEGAIVAAVDAAHLLERSKLATIVRVQTSYVTVEPKRKKREMQRPVSGPAPEPVHARDVLASVSTVPHAPPAAAYPPPQYQASTQEGRPPSRGGRGSPGSKRPERELKRARIVITVRRTPAYKQWLDENPLQAVIARDGDDEDRPTDTQAEKRPSDTKPS